MFAFIIMGAYCLLLCLMYYVGRSMARMAMGNNYKIHSIVKRGFLYFVCAAIATQATLSIISSEVDKNIASFALRDKIFSSSSFSVDTSSNIFTFTTAANRKRIVEKIRYQIDHEVMLIKLTKVSNSDKLTWIGKLEKEPE